MNILFLCHHDFRCNSMTHIAGFAAGLSAAGHSCAVAVPSNRRSIAAVPAPQFTPYLFADLAEQPIRFPDGRSADIVHAWTPRHPVALATLCYQSRANPAARLIVHLEDDEQHLAEQAAGLPFAALLNAAPTQWSPVLARGLVHPWRHRLLLYAADAITCITTGLFCFVPPETPTILLRPPVDEAFFRTTATDMRARLGVAPETRILVYSGNVHPVHAGEVRDLYQAVARLNASGRPTLLLRTGMSPNWFKRSLDPTETRYVRDLGFVERTALPGILASADVLVQPGRPGPFNEHRLPSKIAEFLAVGGAVVMPACNIADELTEGEHALFLHKGDPNEIAVRCIQLFDNEALKQRLRAAARLAARRLFDPAAQAAVLEACYKTALAAPPHAQWAKLSPDDPNERFLFDSATINGELKEALRWAGHTQPTASSWWRRLLSK